MTSSASQIAETPGRTSTSAAENSFEPLGAQARGEILEHFSQLSTADLALRFSATMTAASLARYVDSLDFSRDSFIALRDSKGSLMGIAQVMPVGSDRGAAAEIAFSLAPAARGKGLGARMMQEAVAAARSRGITRLIAQVCPGNAPMLAIFRRAGMTLAREDSEIVGSLAIAPVPN